MRYVLALSTLVLLLVLPREAAAQFQGTVVQTCGTLPQAYSPGSTRMPAIDTNGNLCSSGASPPAGQIPGTTTNDNACAGCVGEFISSQVGLGAAIALTTVTPTTVTSITLTPGDWDVWAVGAFTGAATTTVTYLMASTNVTNAINGSPQRTDLNFNGNTIFASPNETDLPVTQSRYSIASSTTVNLVVQANFGTSTCSAFGGVFARRRR